MRVPKKRDPNISFQTSLLPCSGGKGSGQAAEIEKPAFTFGLQHGQVQIWENVLGKSYVKTPFVRMFGGEAGGFNPDLLSGRLEEMLPTIQQVMNNKYFGPTK